MVGGIIINNASGMNCGTHANSDRILRSMGVILADGTMLDTADEDSRRNFEQVHPEIIREICDIRDEIRSDAELVAQIKRKYSIKMSRVSIFVRLSFTMIRLTLLPIAW